MSGMRDFWYLWRWSIVAGLLAAVAVHLLEISYYYLNIKFILRNINALPFQYQIALGYGQGVWWAFLLSFVTGLLVTICINVRRR